MNNTTYSAKTSELERKWYVIDAEGKVVGRLASEVAKILRGKNKPTFTPNVAVFNLYITILLTKSVLVLSISNTPDAAFE